MARGFSCSRMSERPALHGRDPEMTKVKVTAMLVGLVLALIAGWVVLKVVKVAFLAVLIALAVLLAGAGLVYLAGRQMFGR